MSQARAPAVVEALIQNELEVMVKNELSGIPTPYAPAGCRCETRECDNEYHNPCEYVVHNKNTDRNGLVCADETVPKRTETGYLKCPGCQSTQLRSVNMCGICETPVCEESRINAVERSKEQQQESTGQCNERIRQKERQRSRLKRRRTAPLRKSEIAQGIGVVHRVDLHHTPTKRLTWSHSIGTRHFMMTSKGAVSEGISLSKLGGLR